jgi:hypothetical protein
MRVNNGQSTLADDLRINRFMMQFDDGGIYT